MSDDCGEGAAGLNALGPFFAVGFHQPAAPPLEPWRPLSELLSPGGAVRHRIAAVRLTLAERHGLAVDSIEPRVAASVVHLGITARLVAPALGAAVLGLAGPGDAGGWALDLRPDGLWWQDVFGGPVPLSVPTPGPCPGDGSAGWERVLLNALLAPLTSAVAQLVPVSSRVLWGNVASGINAAAAQLARQRPDLARAGWQTARRLAASPHLRGEPHPPGPGFRRSSCCLFYRLTPDGPPALCGDCVLRSPDR